MDMTEQNVFELLDAWIACDDDSPERRAIEQQLEIDPHGRTWLALHRLMSTEPDDLGVDVRAATMARLPHASPKVYRTVAQAVVMAWSDPDVRRRLRAAPSEELARFGVELPREVSVEVGTLADATMPTADRLVLPLPDDDEMAIDPDEAFIMLVATPFAWPLGTPWSPPDLSDLDVVRDAQSGQPPETTGDNGGDGEERAVLLSWQSGRVKRAAYALGAIAAMLIAGFMLVTVRQGSNLQGAAVDPGAALEGAAAGGGSAGPLIVAAGAITIAAFLVWRLRE